MHTKKSIPGNTAGQWVRPSLLRRLICVMFAGISAEMVMAQSNESTSTSNNDHNSIAMNSTNLTQRTTAFRSQAFPQSDEAQINLFPNPVDDKLTIEFTSGTAPWYLCKIFGPGGKELASMKVTEMNATKSVEFDVSRYCSGQYIVTIITPTKAKSYRIYKR